MLEHLFAVLLFLFGFQSGNVKGESTPSAMVSSSSASMSAKVKKPVNKQVKLLNVQELERAFSLRKEATLAKLQSDRQALIASLVTVKNEEKKQIVQYLQEELNAVNARRTNTQLDHIKLMNTALVELSTQLTQYTTDTGKDGSTVTTKLDQAKQALSDASTSVTDQAGKTYTITITNGDTNIKNDVKKVRKQLEDDLKKVQDGITKARKSLGDAYAAFKSFTGKSATITLPTQAPAGEAILSTNANQSSASGGL